MNRKLHLYNTMTRSVEEFVPGSPGKTSIFTCGPSTYLRPHIGNYRTFLYEDIVVRYLAYLGFDVRRVINFTDVEDKTIVEAENQGRNVADITNEVHRHFFEETELLRIRLPPEIPRSSTSVDQAVEIIQALLESEHAYWFEGDVFFNPLSFDGFGKLYRLDMSTWPTSKVRFKKDTYNGNRWNRGDFILWHGHKNDNQNVIYWESDIGKGRPAWNIQDPAMILQQIGTQIDINCGGIDNIYRHHDYNIAVMESYSGKRFAKYYMHGAHLIVDGSRMSKSRRNILYPEDVVDREFTYSHLRFFLTHSHYRKQLNFTRARFRDSAKRLGSVKSRLERILASTSQNATTPHSVNQIVDEIEPVFQSHMNNDLRLGDAFEAFATQLSTIEDETQGVGISNATRDRINSVVSRIDDVFGFVG